MSNDTDHSGPRVFKLSRPIEFRGQQFAEFTAREPKMRDVRTFIKEVEVDSILAMEKVLANLCGVDNPVMGELYPKDFGVMRKWFEGFLLEMLNESEA
jgi:hypothetical protein